MYYIQKKEKNIFYVGGGGGGGGVTAVVKACFTWITIVPAMRSVYFWRLSPAVTTPMSQSKKRNKP